MHEKHYYKTKSLNEQPISISMGDYWLALEPEPITNASLLVQKTVEKVINERHENLSYLIEVTSPNTELEVRYSHRSGSEDSDMRSLFVYSDDDKAFAVSQDGSGARTNKTSNASIITSVFNLPKLPKDFFYTGIALSNDTIIASWEEQQSYNVGAAGFVMIKAPF
jgi:hypothetical protein